MTSFFWYLLPILFGFVGHAMVSNSLVYDDKIAVKNSLKLAIVSSCIWGVLIILWFNMTAYSE